MALFFKKKKAKGLKKCKIGQDKALETLIMGLDCIENIRSRVRTEDHKILDEMKEMFESQKNQIIKLQKELKNILADPNIEKLDQALVSKAINDTNQVSIDSMNLVEKMLSCIQ